MGGGILIRSLTFTRINDGTSEWVTVNTPWQI
jgi:hypothetical protein